MTVPPEEQAPGVEEAGTPAPEPVDPETGPETVAEPTEPVPSASPADQEELVEVHITAYVTIGGTTYAPKETAMVTPALRRQLISSGYARRD
jgi:hypothetical protein